MVSDRISEETKRIFELDWNRGKKEREKLQPDK